MSTLSSKLIWMFKENAQLREDYLKEILILPCMKPIENSNLKDWSCIRRIHGQITLKERKDEKLWRIGSGKQTLPRKSRKIWPRN